MTLDDATLNRLDHLCSGLSDQPWTVETGGTCYDVVSDRGWLVATAWHGGIAHLIADAPLAIPALVAEVRRLREQLGEAGATEARAVDELARARAAGSRLYAALRALTSANGSEDCRSGEAMWAEADRAAAVWESLDANPMPADAAVEVARG